MGRKISFSGTVDFSCKCLSRPPENGLYVPCSKIIKRDDMKRKKEQYHLDGRAA